MRPLVLLLALAACSSSSESRDPSSTGDERAEPSSPTAPEPEPEPGLEAPPGVTYAHGDSPTCPATAPDDAATGEAQARWARLRLVVPETAASQGELAMTLTNVDDVAHCGYHPGGSNGCAAFRWEVRLTDPSGRVFTNIADDPRQMCTMMMVAPSWVALTPGEETAVAVDLAGGLYPAPSSGEATDLEQASPEREPLEPGGYQVTLLGPGVLATGHVTLE